jgi:hypothetical protein
LTSEYLYAALLVASVLGTAWGSHVVARRQNRRDNAQELSEVVQALEVNNKLLNAANAQLRDELTRVTTHRDYLLAEQAALLKEFLALKKNGNGGAAHH